MLKTYGPVGLALIISVFTLVRQLSADHARIALEQETRILHALIHAGSKPDITVAAGETICRNFVGATWNPTTRQCALVDASAARLGRLEADLVRISAASAANRDPAAENEIGAGYNIVSKRGFQECYRPMGDGYCVPLPAKGQSRFDCRSGRMSSAGQSVSVHGHTKYFIKCLR